MKKRLLATLLIVLFFVSPTNAFAVKGDQGVDLSIWDGYQATFGYAHDKSLISQIGGQNNYGIYSQVIYSSQVASMIAQGKRAHTYVWWQNILIYESAKQVLDYFLPEVQTPERLIVASDTEDGVQSTDVTLWVLDYIKEAGYIPVLYGYKGYLTSPYDLSRIAKKYQLWMAECPDYEATPYPNYSCFPSFENIDTSQSTSTYVAGGLDGNVDLTGITDNGYTKGNQPATSTLAIEEGKEVENMPSSDVKVDGAVKMKFSVDAWAVDEAIPQWAKGNSYKI